MADEADRGNDYAERLTAAGIAHIRAAAGHSAAEATGACLWCDAPTNASRRWCNADCRDAWQREQGRKP